MLTRSSELTPATPREAALRILRAWFGNSPGVPGCAAEWLAPHQQDATARLLPMLERRRGAILADSVGLGKTHVAIAVVNALGPKATALVVPSALRAHWLSHLRRLCSAPENCRLVTHAALSRGCQLRAGAAKLVVVDEAHQFRNPRTRRYSALRALCGQARVLLITATPVNNRLADLEALLHLFARDDAFVDIGVPSLRAAFAASEREQFAAADRVLAEVLVRRTRAVLPPLQGPFPARAVETLRYDFDAHAVELLGLVRELELAWTGERNCAGDLVRLHLLKRLESSMAALHASTSRLTAVARSCLDLLRAGLEPDLATLRRQHDTAGEQLGLDRLLFAPAGRSRWERDTLERDVARLQRGLELIDRAADPKLRVLIAFLRRAHVRRTLVFSQFHDTAVHLWHALSRRWRAGLITGAGAWLGEQPASRAAVLHAFTSADARNAREQVDLLIATDVMAEGMNFQCAELVISYDLPWNPITLVQRAGRIDRLGSPHTLVHIVSVLPDRGLEQWLNLVRTLERKLRVIERTVGVETVMGEHGQDTAARLRPVEAMEKLRARLAQLSTTGGDTGADPVCITAFPGPANVEVIAVARQRQLRLMCATPGRIVEDIELAAAVLERALDAPPCTPLPVDLCRVAAWLESEAATMLEASAATTEVRKRVVEWLRRHETVLDRHPDLLARTDRLLQRLAAVAGTDRLLHAARQLERTTRLESGLHLMERTADTAERMSAAEWRLIAVVQQRAQQPTAFRPGFAR